MGMGETVEVTIMGHDDMVVIGKNWTGCGCRENSGVIFKDDDPFISGALAEEALMAKEVTEDVEDEGDIADG